MRKIFFVILFSIIIAIQNAQPAFAQITKEITVSAAISLKNAFEQIGRIFKGYHPEARLLFNFGASGDLARQIEAGAPVDVFASAAQKDMDGIDRKGFILSGTRTNFAGNGVVLVKPTLSSIRIESFEDLRKAEVKRIVIGNPKTVPAGRYAEEVLKSLNLRDGITDKLVLAENVRQALDYVARNEVDAGIVYMTDAMIRSKEVRIVMKAPQGSHRPVVYPIGVVKGSENELLARDFITFVVSGDGQDILKKYGFETLR
jgi:molybdate transport system substrate-binding protein